MRWANYQIRSDRVEWDGSVLDPSTWGLYDPGRPQGFAPTDDCPYTVVEVHRCFVADVMADEARAVVGELGSYAERFLDGTGVRIFVRGKLPCGTSQAGSGKVVVYDRMRFAVVTGRRLAGAPAAIVDAGDRLRALVRRYFPGRPPITPEGALTDADVIERATRAHGEKFEELLRDDDPEYDRGLELARHLAFWTGRNSAQVHRLLQTLPSRQGRRLPYLERTIREAFADLPQAKDVPVDLVEADDAAVAMALGLVEPCRGLPLWRASFALAQQMLTLGGDPRRFRPAVDAWAAALGHNPDDAWLEFRDAVGKVNHPGGALCKVLARVDDMPAAVPGQADYSARDRRLLAVCYHLAAESKDRTFYFAQDRLAEALGLSQPTVSRTLKMFVADGYIEVVDDHYVFGRGQANKAKTYRWAA